MALQKEFSGDTRFYGVYNPGKINPAKNKVEGSAATLAGPIPDSAWDEHIAGTAGIGIIPIMEDSKCLFCAIDIDDYSVNHKLLISKLSSAGIPGIVCRTKSGGAHVYLFFKRAVPAKDIIPVLRETRIYLGYPQAEIFPKQWKVDKTRGDKGQWINIPYYGGDNTTRYALNSSAAAMSMAEFSEEVARVRMSRNDLRSIVVPLPPEQEIPPCLVKLSSDGGVGAGMRNIAMFNFGVFARMKYEDGWEDKIVELNNEYMDPPLAFNEVAALIKSLDKKTYRYTCAQEPLLSACDKTACAKCPYGAVYVNNSEKLDKVSGPRPVRLKKLNSAPPIWFVTLDCGSIVEVSTGELRNPQRFSEKALEQCNVLVPVHKLFLWDVILGVAMAEGIEVIDTASEETPLGAFTMCLESFISSFPCSSSLDDLVMEEVVIKDGDYYFRLQDLRASLSAGSWRFEPNDISKFLRALGAHNKAVNILVDGHRTSRSVWCLPTGTFEVKGKLRTRASDEAIQ